MIPGDGNEVVQHAGATGVTLPGAGKPTWRSLLSADALTWAAVALGCIVRIAEYLARRPAYMDEKALLRNLAELSVFDFHTTLTEWQLAPPGFLLVERLLVRLPFDRLQTGRFLPFVCGIASMFAMRAVARRYVASRAVPVAVGLFALNDWLLYYSCELKQYSTEILLGLATLWLVAGPKPTADSAEPAGAGSITRRRFFALAALGVVGVWFSFPLSFELAAVGTYLFAASTARKDWALAVRVAAISAVWAGSFALCFAIARAILTKEAFIWNWWDFAFLPLPPRSGADLVRDFWQIINVFNNPAGVLTPLGVLPSAFIATALFGFGCASLARRWPGGLYLLVAPIVLALVASALHQYPFHGRLLLFLVAPLHLLIGEGAALVGRPGGRWLTLALGVFLLYQPAADSLWHHLIARRMHAGFDSHGDLRPDVLDYLHQLEIRSERPPFSP